MPGGTVLIAEPPTARSSSRSPGLGRYIARHRLGIATRAEIEDHRVVLQRANPKPGAAPDELSGRRDRLAARVRRAPTRHSARGGLLGVG